MDFSKKYGQRQQEGASPARPINGKPCDVCIKKGSRPAKFHCAKCTVFYCSDCVTKHNNNPLFREHHVSNLAENRNKLKPCRDHPGKNQSFLCRTCNPRCPLCPICILDHDTVTHDVVDLEKTAKEVRKNLTESLTKVKAKSDLLRDQIQMMKRKTDRQDTILISLHDDIKRHARVLVEGIQKKEQIMLQKAKEELGRKKAMYNQGAYDLDLSNMERITKELEIAIRGSDENCVLSHERLEEQIKHMMNISIPRERTSQREADLKFTPCNIDFSIGTLTYDDVEGNYNAHQNTPKRKHGNDHDPTQDTSLPSQYSSAIKAELVVSRPTSSGAQPVEKKMKRASATGTDKPGKSMHQETPLCKNILQKDIEIPPPIHEPKCAPVFKAASPHIFWDIALSEKKEDDTLAITELCAASSSGVWKSTISDEQPIKQALQEFISFIGDQSAILCGHNIKENKCQSLNNAIITCGLDYSFNTAVAGFIDTSPLLKSKFKDFEPMTIEALYQHCLGKECKVDNIQATVQALQCLVIHAFPDPQERLPYSFQSSFIPDLHEYHKHRRRNFVSWKPLVDNKTVSRHIGDKAAASGLELKHLQFVYATQGFQGLTRLLSNQTTEGKPRVTGKKKVIEELADYLSKAM